MKIIHVRFYSLLTLLAGSRERQEKFRRLLTDRQTGVRIRARIRNPEMDLKRSYGRRMVQSAASTLGLSIAFFLVFPEHHPSVVMGSPPTPVIHVSHIPETTQTQRPPPPPRPSVPLAVEGEDVPEDVTIETTELDLDSIPLDLRIRGPVAMGPPSDDPLDISEIEYKPHPIRIVAPEYPKSAHKSKQEGKVRVRVLVDKKGNVEKVEVMSGPKIFRDAALEAASQFRFRPGRHEGERRKVWMIMPINFSLK